MLHPNRIQAALLFDERFEALETAGRDFCRIVELKFGIPFASLEGAGSEFIRYLSAQGDLMVTFELVSGPPRLEPFEGALASPVTGLFAPTMRDAIILARSHVLLEVQHLVRGTLPGDVAGGASRNPATLFAQRLELLELMTRLTADQAAPSAIHWTQSDQLLTPERFEGLVTLGLPGPLHVHPHLFGSVGSSDAGTDDDGVLGLRTFGAAHWLGREVVVEPSALDWQAAYEAALAFVHMATGEDGALIPHGDTFGSSDGGESFRVLHREADPERGEDAAYVIVPLRHDPSGFVSESYAQTTQIVCDRGQAQTATDAEEAASPAEDEDQPPVEAPVEAPAEAPAESQPEPTASAEPVEPAEPAEATSEPRPMPQEPGAELEIDVPVGDAAPAPSIDPDTPPGPAPQTSELAMSGEPVSEQAAGASDPAAPEPASQPAPPERRGKPKGKERVMIRPVQSQPGEDSVSGRSLRHRVFGRAED